MFATVLNNQYVPGWIVMVKSMQNYLSIWSEVEIKVYFHKELSPLNHENQKAIRQIEPKIQFIEVGLEKDFLDSYLPQKRFKQAYLIFEAFAEDDFEKVICFDADMMCINEFSELFHLLKKPGLYASLEMEPYPDYFFVNRAIRSIFRSTMISDSSIFLKGKEKSIMHYRNFRIMMSRQIKAFCGFSKEKFTYRSQINTGFFVINLIQNKQLRDALHKLANESLSNLTDDSDWFADQTVLNEFKESNPMQMPFYPLSYRFNCTKGIYRNHEESDLRKAYIIHFTGEHKPWREPKNQKEVLIYQQYPFSEWKKHV